ncbi:MAG: hypothetical protein ACOYXW_00295, partial [Actinomycetota bacterium]
MTSALFRRKWSYVLAISVTVLGLTLLTIVRAQARTESPTPYETSQQPLGSNTYTPDAKPVFLDGKATTWERIS